MQTRRATRRQLLKLALGAGSVALLDRAGITPGTRAAYAVNGFGPNSGKPTKLLTIYVGGGWVPMYLWCPLSASEILSHLPVPQNSNFDNSETCFFTPAQVTNTDGSGDALDSEGYAKLRIPRTWDEPALLSGASNVSKHTGWSWAYPGWNVWSRANVVHGVDMQTADHRSAQISTLCGIPGPTFSSPSMHAWVASAMADAYGDDRPLGSVNIGNTLTSPGASYLPPSASPVAINDIADLAYFLAETKGQAWNGLRNRAPNAQTDYWGQSLDVPIPTNSMDEHVLARTQGLAGGPNDALFEKIYETYKLTSRQLAKDVVSTLQSTPGLDDSMEVPSWYNHFVYKHFFTRVGGTTHGQKYTPQFDLALRLLRSDLCSAVHVRVGDRYHDDHSAGHRTHYPYIRADFENIGRMLAYMNMVSIGNGKTLLDDTLVIITSDFGRTWPLGGTCDHWPGDSVCFAGGNTHGNRMIGGYDLSTGGPTSLGFMGTSIPLLDENGDPIERPPQSRDIILTAMHMMGIPDVFLPGGPGRIVGVEQS